MSAFDYGEDKKRPTWFVRAEAAFLASYSGRPILSASSRLSLILLLEYVLFARVGRPQAQKSSCPASGSRLGANVDNQKILISLTSLTASVSGNV
jgi:hypothetical protein